MKTLTAISTPLILLVFIASLSPRVYANRFIEEVYFGIGPAYTKLQINEQNIRAVNSISNTSSLQNSEPGYTIFIGSKLDQYLSIELGYTDFGNYSVQSNGQKRELFSANSLSLTSSISYPINQNFNIYAKAGFSGWLMESKNISLQDDGTGLVYGAGFDINLYNSNNRTLQIEWLHQEFDDIFLSKSDSISASLVFRF